jgi:DNA-binding beta-propeller fold protein YncE/mono/diheme cytochrome c family protein
MHPSSLHLLALPLLVLACGPASAVPPRALPAPPIAPEAAVPASLPTATPPPAPACARLAAAPPVVPVAPTFAGSTIALAGAGGRTIAYVADEDERAVRTLDPASGEELAFTPLDAAPGPLLVTADGRVLVTLRGGNAIAVLEPAVDPAMPLALRCSVAVPAEPSGLATTPDGARLVVTSRWGRTLTGYDLASLASLFTVPLPRDPAGVVTSADGAKAFVAHVVGARMSVVDLAAQTVRDVDLHQVERPSAWSLSPPVHWSAGQGYALVRTAAGRILAPGILANPTMDTDLPPPSGYGPGGAPTEIGEVSVLDEKTDALSTTPVLDFRDHATCLLPRAAAVDEAGGRLLVACLGEGVRIYDARAKLPHLAPIRRIEVPDGPTGIALDARGKRAYVWSQFTRTLSVLALDAQPWTGDDLPRIPTTAPFSSADSPARLPYPIFEKAPPPTGSNRPLATFKLPVHRADLDERFALGRRLFHEAASTRIAGDGRACASCHPDGRDDGLTWATPEGPRQTPMLAARLADTAPYSWDGANADLTGHTRRTLHRLVGHGLGKPELEALLTYVSRMEAPAPPAAPDPRTARGEALFKSPETGCADCHSGGGTTDRQTHDVASQAKGDKAAQFDTPSLRFIGKSAPYFHDGRYATLDALLRGVDGTMGHTGQLDPEDRKALVAYLEAL